MRPHPAPGWRGKDRCCCFTPISANRGTPAPPNVPPLPSIPIHPENRTKPCSLIFVYRHLIGCPLFPHTQKDIGTRYLIFGIIVLLLNAPSSGPPQDGPHSYGSSHVYPQPLPIPSSLTKWAA